MSLRAGDERVEIVAADAALHLGKARRDFVGFARADGEQVFAQAAAAATPTSDRSSPMRPKCASVPSASTASIDEHIVAHGAVAQRAAAAGIVAGHAADGGARGGRDIDRKPQAVRFELRG